MPDLGPCMHGQGWKDKRGYLRCRRDGKMYLVHRLAWIDAYGPIAEGLFVCHKCDNPPCIRLDHLFLGTQKDNMADCAAKGRYRSGGLRGDAHGFARLTEERAIGAMARLLCGETQTSVARAFGVHTSTINLVWSGKTWGWLFTEPDADDPLKGETNDANDQRE